MVKDIERANRVITSDGWFPRLKGDKKYKVTSKINKRYNCIAWAMRLRDRWVDSEKTAGHWWPITITTYSWQKDELVKAFEALKFVKCNTSKHEFLYDKVSLYYNPKYGNWTHAARVISPIEYHSKLGNSWDIHHSDGSVLHNPNDLKGTYGKEFQFMKRHKVFRLYSLWLIIKRLSFGFFDSLR